MSEREPRERSNANVRGKVERELRNGHYKREVRYLLERLLEIDGPAHLTHPVIDKGRATKFPVIPPLEGTKPQRLNDAAWTLARHQAVVVTLLPGKRDSAVFAIPSYRRPMLEKALSEVPLPENAQSQSQPDL